MEGFQKRRLILLTGGVVFVHLFFFLFDFEAKKETSSPKKPLIVHTFVVSPPQKQKSTYSTKGAVHSKTIQKPKRPSSPSPKKDLLKQLKETLKHAEQGAESSAEDTPLTFPKTIQSLQIDQTETLKTPDYFLLLAQRLKEELELPEYGDVKLELTLHKSGKVLKVKILQAVSEKNRRYLELNLLKMDFPPLDDEFKNQPMHTFALTFCNEI